MVHVQTLIVVAKTATLLLGGLITLFSFRAYRRTGALALRALATGFAFVTLGSLVGGVIDLLTDVGLLNGVLVQSVLTAIGFGIITYSLYTSE